MPDGFVCTKGNREKFCKAKLGDLTKIRTTVANSRGAIELVSIEQLGAEFLQINYTKLNAGCDADLAGFGWSEPLLECPMPRGCASIRKRCACCS